MVQLHDVFQLIMSSSFSKLDAHFRSFNPLRVLRVDQSEIRHSNVIYWLLDPAENHQLGSKVLERFVGELMTNARNDKFYTDSEWLVEMPSFTYMDWLVERDVKTAGNEIIDIILVSELNKTVLFIENKYDNTEFEGQLDKYYETLRANYVGYLIVPINMTLKGDLSSNDNYLTIDYSNVAQAIAFVLEEQQEAITDDIYRFIQHYLEVIQNKIIPDTKTVSIANEVFEKYSESVLYLYSVFNAHKKKRSFHTKYIKMSALMAEAEYLLQAEIYIKNKKVIDFIYEKGMEVFKKAFQLAVLDVYPKETTYMAHNTYPNFIHPTWERFESFLLYLKEGEIYWRGYGLIVYFSRVDEETVMMFIEIGPLRYENRLALLDALESKGYSISNSSKKEGSKYTRIFKEKITLKDWTSIQEVRSELVQRLQSKSFTKTIQDLEHALEQVNEVINPVISNNS